MSFRFERIDIPTKYVASLGWRGDTLVDSRHGPTTYYLDGTQSQRNRGYSYKFDAAVTSPTGDYAFVYERLGTKGLLLDSIGNIVREVNRSYYHAHVHEFPIALFRLPDGREVMAHCPDAYNRIEIDLLPDGQRLTARKPDPEACDFFQSRLAPSPGRTRLLSAGWAWSPLELVAVYEVPAALSDPTTLDKCWQPPINSDVTAAAFGGDDLLLLVTALGGEAINDEPDDPESALSPGTVGAFDLVANRYVSIAPLEDEAGTIMPLGAGHLIGFYDHPKLIEVATGKVLYRWPDLKTGHQNGSIIWGLKSPPPPLALDPLHMRFAVASEELIAVVQVIPAP
jgi:hypothetical protein